MPKTRSQKETLVASYEDRLSRSQSIVFVKISNVKVSEIEQIRNALFSQGLQLQVAKNNLLERVFSDKGIEVPAELLDQPLALIYGYEDAVAAPKTVAPITKEIEALEVLGGLMGTKYISVAEVQQLASLPGREQLLAQLVGTLAAPMSGTVNVLAGTLRGFVTALSQIADTKQA